ncbi:AMP-dependent synthetase/ligase [Sphingomicrobium astaxanthinifaciens]|uniref:AMP-dependent synthetase/ligase n=1 Tax=Sphingomicrobium astaxanthinifaciens TaxID=1227949 RepID=UPI001FCB3932|nr:long-chain fatty acid--CoA ligase [Sphingomicrobium astaxanthinifaciens]MCJ7421328.1 long-chain fatty acid--CoA ligase [Sphingomicrobium astaxanthinifaciens]
MASRRTELEHFPNLVTMFFTRAREKGDAPFLWAKKDGGWQSISWRRASEMVAGMAQGLRNLGMEEGDRVMLVSENRPEWLIADLAIMAAGCVTVPTYTTNTTRDHQHILGNSDARAVIVSTQKLAEPLIPAVLFASECHHIISIDDIITGQSPDVAKFHHWGDLVETEADLIAFEEEARQKGRSDLACLIYTSGTGGAPRGVKQHHGMILHNVEGCVDVIANDFGWDDEVFLSFLPASHAYEHTGGQHFPIGLGAQIYYAEGLEKLAANIEETRPTIMVVVPRLFEMLRAKMLKTIEKEGGLAAYLLKRALQIEAKRYEGRSSLLDAPMDAILSQTLRKKVRDKFGGRMKAMVSGGAPLNPEVGLFFQAMGLTMLQGYGQTESGPVISCNRPSAGLRMDTVGPPLKNTEVKIAEDGEICVRGELVMTGYWRNKDDTAKVLDEDGWLLTGDVGHLDEKGRIKITDRKKDLIVLDKGDNVAPQRIEGILTLQPEIGQAMVYGDRRPYIVALLVPDAEATRGMNAEEVKRALGEAVDRVNADLSVIEKVRRFIIADEPFTVDNEMLTPKQSIRRHKINAVYEERLGKLYKR